MNDDIEFSFPSSDDAVECMRAIDGIADWEVARRYGCPGRHLNIVPEYLRKEPKEVREKIAKIITAYGGEPK